MSRILFKFMSQRYAQYSGDLLVKVMVFLNNSTIIADVLFFEIQYLAELERPKNWLRVPETRLF